MRGPADRAAFAENTSRGVIALILLYLVLIGIIIAFSRTFITTLAGASPSAATIALVVALAVPIALFAVALFQIIRLLRGRSAGQAAAGLRLQLLLFFILIAILSAGPQAMLGITFVNSAMGTWFSSSIGSSLRGAITMAVGYQRERQDSLSAFMDGPLLPRFVADFTDAPLDTWREIQGANSGIGAFQIFNVNGTEVAFQGDVRARLTGPQETNGKEDRENVTILRQSRTISVGGKHVTAVASALLSADLRVNVRALSQSLTVFTSLDQYGQLFRRVLVAFFFLFSLPLFLITILVSLVLSQRIISPIAHLEDATRRVAEGDFGFRVLTRPRDELSALVDSFNGMISELDRSRRKLLQAEKITAWQEIAQRLAHEIRNPLTPIKLSAQRVLKKYDDGAADFDKVLRPAVGSIITEVENLERMLREFSELARLPVPKPAAIRLRELLVEVASVYKNLSSAVLIDLSDVSESLVINVDRDQLKRAFANLFTNAIQAMPSGGSLTARADLVKKSHTVFCRIAVSDTGTGIPDADLDSIFDPYFTTKKNGTGLGLAIVQRIVFDHKGNVWAESDGSTGTTFFIDLPIETPGGPTA